jgi:hypothetical protein
LDAIVMSHELLNSAVTWAGIGQLILALASLMIPGVLNWKRDLEKLRPLTRQVFWTYAGYIWFTNVSFGLVSTGIPGALLDASPLAACVTGFITLYWGARCAIQWFYYDRSEAPGGWAIRLAETTLNLLFVLLTGVYAVALWWNFRRTLA